MDTDDAPATKRDLRELEDRLTGRMHGQMTESEDRLVGRMHDQMTELEDRLVERMRDMQTEIVRVFMDFQERNERRDAIQEKTSSVLAERVASLEHRLLQIEKKLFLEPPAA